MANGMFGNYGAGLGAYKPPKPAFDPWKAWQSRNAPSSGQLKAQQGGSGSMQLLPHRPGVTPPSAAAIQTLPARPGPQYFTTPSELKDRQMLLVDRADGMNTYRRRPGDPANGTPVSPPPTPGRNFRRFDSGPRSDEYIAANLPHLEAPTPPRDVAMNSTTALERGEPDATVWTRGPNGEWLNPAQRRAQAPATAAPRPPMPAPPRGPAGTPENVSSYVSTGGPMPDVRPGFGSNNLIGSPEMYRDLGQTPPRLPTDMLMGEVGRNLRVLNERSEEAMRSRQPPPYGPSLQQQAMEKTNAGIAANNAAVGLGIEYTGRDPGFGPNNPWRKATMRGVGPAVGPGDSTMRNSEWDINNRGAQAPEGVVAQSRFGGAMIYTDPSGRAKFIKPRVGGEPGGRTPSGEPMTPEMAMARVEDRRREQANGPPRTQQDALRDYFAKREAAGLPTPASIAAAAPTPGIPAPPTPDAAGPSFAPPPPGQPSARDLITQRAQQEAMARRERLANRNAPPNPMMGMLMQNPDLALGMARLNQQGLLAQQQATLADRELAMRGDELAQRRLAEAAQAQRDHEWRMFAGQNERTRLENDKQPSMREQAIAAAIAAGEDPIAAGQAWDEATGAQPGQPAQPGRAPQLSRADRESMVGMTRAQMLQFLTARKITDPEQRMAIIREFFPREAGLLGGSDLQPGTTPGAALLGLHPLVGGFELGRSLFDPTYEIAGSRYVRGMRQKTPK